MFESKRANIQHIGYRQRTSIKSNVYSIGYTFFVLKRYLSAFGIQRWRACSIYLFGSNSISFICIHTHSERYYMRCAPCRRCGMDGANDKHHDDTYADTYREYGCRRDGNIRVHGALSLDLLGLQYVVHIARTF